VTAWLVGNAWCFTAAACGKTNSGCSTVDSGSAQTLYSSPQFAERDLPASESPYALYLRAANALDRSAALAEDHAERLRDNGEGELAGLELERAQRAREGAERGRAFASRLR
jgi:hypothetical protein